MPLFDAGGTGSEFRQKLIGFLSGYCTTTTVKVVVASLASGNVTVRANSVDYTVTLAALAGVMFVGSTTLTGLTAGTRYAVTLTQGANVEADCATWTAPTAGTNFRLYYASCDDPGVVGATNGDNTGGGMWRRIAEYALNQSTARRVYCLFHDDFCYSSRYAINGTEKQTSGVPGTTALQADYAVTYANALGLLGGTDNKIKWGQNVWRMMALRSMPVFPQFGDWEFDDDLGWDLAFPNDDFIARPALGDPNYVAGKAVWDVIFGPLQPPSIGSADTTANHWSITLGDVKIVVPDGITRSTGQYHYDAPAVFTTMTAILGVNQITDILTALDSTVAFKVLSMSLGVRYMCDPALAYEFNAGQQHPIEPHCLNEHQRLYSRSGLTPPSIMANAKLNGGTGKLIAWHGDTHVASLFENRRAGYTDGAGTHVAENWDSWFIGTINGSQNFVLQAEAVPYHTAGSGYGGTTVVWTQLDDDSSAARRHCFSLYADVVGTATPKQFNCAIIDRAGTVKASRSYTV